MKPEQLITSKRFYCLMNNYIGAYINEPSKYNLDGYPFFENNAVKVTKVIQLKS